VFFNLFAAAELQVSVKITHGTPRSDSWVLQRRWGWSFRVSGGWCSQRSRNRKPMGIWAAKQKLV